MFDARITIMTRDRDPTPRQMGQAMFLAWSKVAKWQLYFVVTILVIICVVRKGADLFDAEYKAVTGHQLFYHGHLYTEQDHPPR